MQKGATARLFVDEITFDLSNNGQTISVAGGPERLRFNAERRESQRWAGLRIARKKETLVVALNGQEVVRFDDKGRSYRRVGLKPTGGTIEVNRFTPIGHVVRQTKK